MKTEIKNSFLFILLTALNLTAQEPLVGCWTFEDTDNLVKATVGNDLVLVGSHSSVSGPDAENRAVKIGIGSYYICQHNIPLNGNGEKVNEFTIVMDVKFNQASVWYTLYQTDVLNQTDGEWFVDRSGKMGVHATGYSSPVITANKWYRLAIAVKNGERYDYYINGNPVLRGQPGVIDDRFSLEPTVLLFADDNQEDNSVDVSEIRIYSQALSDDEIDELGGFDQSGTHDQSDPFLTVDYLSEHELRLVLDNEMHDNYGFAYPVTYKIDIPANSSDLITYIRYSTSESWQQVEEKQSSDFFNGLEAVRFDYSAGLAFVSAAFSSASDSLFIKISDGIQEIPISFLDICKYYDDRKAVVTASADDWADRGDQTWYQSDEAFQITCRQFRKHKLWLTCGIITQYCGSETWQHIQTQLDSGYVEACSHSRTHSYGPYEDPEGEIAGSKQDIFDNLDLPLLFKKHDLEYVYTWLAPAHYYDEIVNTLVGAEKYLVNRLYNWPYDIFSDWNPAAGYYFPIGMSREVSPIWEGTTDLDDLNSYFDIVVDKGGIYHVMTHPYFLLENGFNAAQYAWDHLDYISQKNDIWYVCLGHLYLYHYLKENVAVATSVTKSEDKITPELMLLQNYPNPFNSQTVIKYALPKACHVSLKIYNMLGKEVRVLVNDPQADGNKSVVWDGKDNSGEMVTSGAYIYKIEAGKFNQSNIMMFIK